MTDRIANWLHESARNERAGRVADWRGPWPLEFPASKSDVRANNERIARTLQVRK